MSIPLPRTADEITEIYRNHVDMVYRIGFMLLKNTPESEDATQTVFIKLMQTDKEFESDAHLKAWLIVTARNTCKDILKSFWRSKRADLDDADACSGFNDGGLSDVWEAVSALPEPYRLPVYLYYYEGYATAKSPKCSVSTTPLCGPACVRRGKS
jgi:RNA polymerase sigma-70 factor (ECF subfamily)